MSQGLSVGDWGSEELSCEKSALDRNPDPTHLLLQLSYTIPLLLF